MPPIYIGNQSLLNLPKTAFLSSRKISSEAILKCYDWATEQRDKGICVIGGFHSKIEKDVLSFLIKGKQPIIMVQGRGIYKVMPKEIEQALHENRLLIISVAPNALRHSEKTAYKRNKYIIGQAEKIVIGSLDKNGMLYQLMQEQPLQEKEIIIL